VSTEIEKSDDFLLCETDQPSPRAITLRDCMYLLWIKVEVELPKNGDKILVSNGKDWCEAKYNNNVFVMFHLKGSCPLEHITHWLRPELPEERKDNGK